MLKTTGLMALAREKLHRITGKKFYKHVHLLAAIHEHTGVEYKGGDINEYLLTFTREVVVPTMPSEVRQAKMYTPDTAMRLASKRAQYQPEQISITSKVRGYVERGDGNG